MFSRLRSLFRAWAIPGWIFFLWEAVDHISRLDFAISKGTTAVRALLSFLAAHPGLRLIVGIAWLTLVVMWPKDPTKRRNMEAGISASLETPQLEISLVQTSDEFGRVFSDFGESLTAYFTVVDEFLDNQLAVASWRLDQLSEDIREKYAKRTHTIIDQDPEQREKTLRDMAASVATDAADSVEKKERIAEAVSQMKSKNREILVAYSTLLQAWQQVNRALYLKREDKLQAQALAEKLRTIQEKIQAAYDEVKP